MLRTPHSITREASPASYSFPLGWLACMEDVPREGPRLSIVAQCPRLCHGGFQLGTNN